MEKVSDKNLNLVKDFNQEITELSKLKNPKKRVLALVAVLVIIAGVSTGYFLSRGGSLVKEDIQREVSQEEVKVGVTVGVSDEKIYKDSTEGKLEKGGIDGEGSHHLVRPGGEDQTVYLTSSIVDLDKFVGHKVKIWGETFAAQKAGWLMDIGKLKVLE